MPLRRTIFTTFIIALITLAVFSGFTSAVAEASGKYMLKVSARKVKPNDEIQLVVRSAKPGETLFILIMDEKGDPISTSILKVYKGVAAQVGHLIIVKTNMTDSLAVLCIRAPSKPGVYLIKLYNSIGEVQAEEQILVEWTLQQLLGRPEAVVVGLLVLAAVLAIVYVFLLTPG